MSNFNLRLSLTEIVTQLVIIWVTVQFSFSFNSQYNLIPDFILHVPAFYTSENDLSTISSVYLITFLLIGIASQFVNGAGVFADYRRFAKEYLLYLCAYTTSSVYVFLATTTNYDPQLFAAIGVFSTLAYILVFVLWRSLSLKNFNFLSIILDLVVAVLRQLVSWKGVLVFVYFLSPLLLAKAYVSNRDIANIVTQVRFFFNPVQETTWGLNNVYPEVRLGQPMLIKQAPRDDDSIYILERDGRILHMAYPVASEYEVSLDIGQLMGEVEIENGALGFAFHPDYDLPNSENFGYIYFYYTDTRGEMQVNRLSRFDLSLPTMEQRLNSELPLLALDRNNEGWHNGGDVQFGPDEYLYIGVGEGVHPLGVTDSSQLLRAGMLRIDVDVNNTAGSQLPSLPLLYGEAGNYLVPRDNPFIDNPAVMDEYWVLGLRNPFRFSFDAQNGQLWLGDVGTTVWEEVNLIERGKNYQFPFIEGNSETGIARPSVVHGAEQGPVYTYEHTAYDRAVIGGIVYRGDAYPELTGKYIFADNYSAKIFLLDIDTRPVNEPEVIARGSQFAQRGVSSVTQLRSGDVLVTALGAASEASGEILQLVPAAEVQNTGQFDEATESSLEESTPNVYNSELTRASFEINCSRCHGFSGDGNSPDAGALGVPLPDFTAIDYQDSRSDTEIFDIIYDGGAEHGLSPLMPPWGEFLGEEEVGFLTDYIRELGSSN